MPLDVGGTGKETGWLSKYAFQIGALAADAIGRQAIAESFFAATAAMRAKFADGFINAAKLATDAVSTVKILADAVTEVKLARPSSDGLHPHRIARATYDFAVLGGAISTIGLGVTLPDNAIITRAWYEVITTLTSATDAATVSIDIPTDDVAGIVAAIAISNVANAWDAGLKEAIQDGTAANFSTKATAARALSITIAVEAVTAGKFILFAEYVVSD